MMAKEAVRNFDGLSDRPFAVYQIYDGVYDLTASWKRQCDRAITKPKCMRQIFSPLDCGFCRHHQEAYGALKSSHPGCWAHQSRKLIRFFGCVWDEMLAELNPEFKAWLEMEKRRMERCAYSESQNGSGLTSILLVNRTMYAEASQVLSEETEFVVSIVDVERPCGKASDLKRIHSIDLAYFSFARNLKLNIVSHGDDSCDRLI